MIAIYREYHNDVYLRYITYKTKGKLMRILSVIMPLLLLSVCSYASEYTDGLAGNTPPLTDLEYHGFHVTDTPAVQRVVYNTLPLAADTAQWTWLFFDDSDFTNSYKPFNQFVSEAYSTAQLNVFVLQDTDIGPAYLYYIPESGAPVLLESWGEVSMGSPETLFDLIDWGKSNHPAHRYMVTIYDHGGGWWGACVDVTNDNDFLYMDEMQSAIEQAGGIDILAFTAPCVMGALESAYELRDCTDVYIGSEDLSGYIYWHDIMDDICGILSESSSLTSEEIGSLIVDLVETNVVPPWEEWATMSAIDQSELDAMVTVFEELCAYMTNNVTQLAPVIQSARADAWVMGNGGAFDVDETDLYDFLEVYLAAETDPFTVSKLQELMNLFPTVIINECRGTQQARAHGLSIYFPVDEASSQIDSYSNPGIGLDFAAETSWDNFLIAYYSWQQSGINDDDSWDSLTIHPVQNPFLSSVELQYSSSVAGSVFMEIHDLAGRRVHFSSHEYPGSGTALFTWNREELTGGSVCPGVYIVSVTDMSGNTTCAKIAVLQ